MSARERRQVLRQVRARIAHEAKRCVRYGVQAGRALARQARDTYPVWGPLAIRVGQVLWVLHDAHEPGQAEMPDEGPH